MFNMFQMKLQVWFIIVLLGCGLPSEIFSADQTKSTNVPIFCNRLIPGLERMTHGIDITRLDIFSKDSNTDDGFRTAIFGLTCNLNRKWSHENIPNVEYDRPDQISTIATVSSGKMKSKGYLCRTITDIKASLLINVDINFGLDSKLGFLDKLAKKAFGTFSGSGNFKAALNLIFANNVSIYEISSTVSSVRIDFDGSPFLDHSKAFGHYLSELTGFYDEQPNKYDEFVHMFGTHYFSSALFGGLLKQTVSVNNSYIKAAGELDVKNNIEVSVLPVFNVKGKIEANVKPTYHTFEQNSETKFAYFGGIMDILPSSDKGQESPFFTKWVPTVNKLPWLLGGSLLPLENLIQNETVKTQLKKAITIHRIKAYFQELNMTKTLSKFHFNQEQLSKFHNVQHFIVSSKFSSTDQMAQDIEDLLSTIDQGYTSDLNSGKSFAIGELPKRLPEKTYIMIPYSDE